MNMSENACLTTEGQLPIVRWRVLGWRGCQQDWAASAPLGSHAADDFFCPPQSVIPARSLSPERNADHAASAKLGIRSHRRVG
jgi:hypothetical protein